MDASAALFRHVGLTVSDIDRSLAFWHDALGLELVARQSQERGYIEEVTREVDAHVLQAHLRFSGSDCFVELLQYVTPTLQLLIGVLIYREPFSGMQLIGYGAIWIALALYSLDGLWRAQFARA